MGTSELGTTTYYYYYYYDDVLRTTTYYELLFCTFCNLSTYRTYYTFYACHYYACPLTTMTGRPTSTCKHLPGKHRL